jgi:hypothetical protein
MQRTQLKNIPNLFIASIVLELKRVQTPFFLLKIRVPFVFLHQIFAKEYLLAI